MRSATIPGSGSNVPCVLASSLGSSSSTNQSLRIGLLRATEANANRMNSRTAGFPSLHYIRLAVIACQQLSGFAILSEILLNLVPRELPGHAIADVGEVAQRRRHGTDLDLGSQRFVIAA